MGFLKEKRTELNWKSKLSLWLIKQFKTMLMKIDLSIFFGCFHCIDQKRKTTSTKKSKSDKTKKLCITLAKNKFM